MKNKLKVYIDKHDRLGDANADSGYYNYWRLLMSVNLSLSNSFWDKNERIIGKEHHEI